MGPGSVGTTDKSLAGSVAVSGFMLTYEQVSGIFGGGSGAVWDVPLWVGVGCARNVGSVCGARREGESLCMGMRGQH